jgi:hypothetical protein
MPRCGDQESEGRFTAFLEALVDIICRILDLI